MNIEGIKNLSVFLEKHRLPGGHADRPGNRPARRRARGPRPCYPAGVGRAPGSFVRLNRRIRQTQGAMRIMILPRT